MLQWMVYVTIVTLIVALAALAAERALRLRRQRTRWVWTTAIVASLVIPALIGSVSIQLPSITPAADASPEIISLRNETSLPLTALVPVRMRSARATLGLNARLGLGWLIASGSLLLFLPGSALLLAWRKHTWPRATVAGVSVRIARDVGPAVVGLLNPCIVLPPWVLEASPSCQAHIIAHEQSHLAARDPLLIALALCLIALLPWNLPLWWQLRRLRRAIEVDCDARVLLAGHDLHGYGQTLIAVGQRQSRYPGPVASMSESRSFLEQRIRLMLREPRRQWQTAAALLGCAAVCLLALAAQVSPPTAGPSEAQASSVAAVDPAVYDAYLGYYRFDEHAVLTVSRQSHRLLLRLTGQPQLEIFPSSPTQYFAKIANMRVTFVTDAQGRATALTLLENGVNHTAPRIGRALAQQIEAAVNARVASQVPAPGSAAALRHQYAGLLAGKPDYSILSPALAQATRAQLPQLEELARRFGNIESMQFLGVGPEGADVYTVHHVHGLTRWQISLSREGKIDLLWAQVGP